MGIVLFSPLLLKFFCLLFMPPILPRTKGERDGEKKREKREEKRGLAKNHFIKLGFEIENIAPINNNWWF